MIIYQPLINPLLPAGPLGELHVPIWPLAPLGGGTAGVPRHIGWQINAVDLSGRIQALLRGSLGPPAAVPYIWLPIASSLYFAVGGDYVIGGQMRDNVFPYLELMIINQSLAGSQNITVWAALEGEDNG